MRTSARYKLTGTEQGHVWDVCAEAEGLSGESQRGEDVGKAIAHVGDEPVAVGVLGTEAGTLLLNKQARQCLQDQVDASAIAITVLLSENASLREQAANRSAVVVPPARAQATYE